MAAKKKNRRQRQQTVREPFPTSHLMAQALWNAAPSRIKAIAVGIALAFAAIVLGGILVTWITLL